MNRFERIAGNIVADSRLFTIPIDDPKLHPLFEKFNYLRWSLRDYGAFEPGVHNTFLDILKRAVKHMSFPNMKPEDWGLDTGMNKWQFAAHKLTDAAKNIFMQMKNTPKEDIQDIANYYDEGKVAKIAEVVIRNINEKAII